MFDPLVQLLRRLQIEEAECIFCHCGLQKLGIALRDGLAWLRCLLDWLGPRCTCVSPAFPFATNSEYRRYVETPINYDVSLTPARVNLFGELFRRQPGVLRSLHPILPVAAHGPLAAEIIVDSHLDEMPFGSRTSFMKMTRFHTKVLGLGVDLNTNSFAHLLDEEFLDRLPVRAYSDGPVPARLFRNRMFLETRSYYYVTPEVRSRIRPGRLHQLIAEAPFYRHTSGPVPAYSLDLSAFLKAGREVALQAFASDQLPVWHRGTPPQELREK